LNEHIFHIYICIQTYLGGAKHKQGHKKKADVLRRCLPATGLTIDGPDSYCHIEMAKQLQVSVCSYIKGEHMFIYRGREREKCMHINI
jgi:hypothetical protein